MKRMKARMIGGRLFITFTFVHEICKFYTDLFETRKIGWLFNFSKEYNLFGWTCPSPRGYTV